MRPSEAAPARHALRFERAARFYFLVLAVWLPAAFPLFAGNYFQGVSPASVPWPGGIVPYLFDTNYTITPTEKNVILAGLREWELAANVKFVPYVSQSNYVLLQFTNDNSGTGFCLLGTPSTIMLHGLARGLMCHEAGHLLGLQHEHQRVDRDNFIVINPANIAGGTNADSGLSAFLIDSNSTPFGPYDFESVMHYSPGNFSIGPGFDSLDPLPPFEKFYHKIGNPALSIGDRAAVAHLYGPPATPLTNVVTTTADGGFGSLRAAIYYANDHPGTTIRFDIPNTDANFSNGVYTIYLLGELPPLVSAGTAIDGTTQPGYAGSPVIALDGSQVSPEAGDVSGLHLYGTNGVVRALAIDNFNYSGIQLFCSDAVSNRVEGCYLGVKPDGTNAAPDNFAGAIFEFGAHNNFIGNTNRAARNIISGNIFYGVLINDTNSDANAILGNFIGLDAAGRFAVPNGKSGVGVFFDQRDTVIGGATPGAGNVLSGNGEYGIYLDGTNNTGDLIQGNFIGTDATGDNIVSNAFGGVAVFDFAHGVTIGGTNAAARNVISGNGGAGIFFQGPGCSNNLVQGNYLGVNVAGTTALPNSQAGLFLVNGTAETLIGGATPGAGNLISGNLQYGIFISDSGTSNNIVQGNLIGTDFTGTNPLPNGNEIDGGGGVGILTGAADNLVGGATPGARNVISGNIPYGVIVDGANTATVQGNLIGADLTGTNALGNDTAGVGIFGAATNNLIGGATPGAANLISGNGTYGLFISDANTSRNFVEGNLVGTDIAGEKALANGFAGVAIFLAASGNSIGGAATGAANLISGNGTYGVFISDAGTTENSVEGNFIGTDLTGTNALGNGFADVVVQSGASGNSIGGVTAGAGNAIAFAGGPGVVLFDAATTNNAIRGNSIFSNAALGIDLNNDGVSPNHSGFLAGPNDFQNFPVITNAVAGGATTTVSGKLNASPNGSFFIDVYRDTDADSSGFGEGRFYAGSASVNTDNSGDGAFTLNVAGNFAGQFFTATATAATGDTSEFSADVLAGNAPAPPQFTGSFALTGAGFSAQISVATGQPYRIQATTNLANPAAWTDLTNFTANSSSFLFVDPAAANFRARFYRVVSP